VCGGVEQHFLSQSEPLDTQEICLYVLPRIDTAGPLPHSWAAVVDVAELLAEIGLGKIRDRQANG
jgi:hypothetical protein